ncbi:MAG: hypothetical protein K2N12_08355 [Helicobacter sp.]|nr:hypothetical protein [Helicobacter sp.]
MKKLLFMLPILGILYAENVKYQNEFFLSFVVQPGYYQSTFENGAKTSSDIGFYNGIRIGYVWQNARIYFSGENGFLGQGKYTGQSVPLGGEAVYTYPRKGSIISDSTLQLKWGYNLFPMLKNERDELFLDIGLGIKGNQDVMIPFPATRAMLTYSIGLEGRHFLGNSMALLYGVEYWHSNVKDSGFVEVSDDSSYHFNPSKTSVDMTSDSAHYGIHVFVGSSWELGKYQLIFDVPIPVRFLTKLTFDRGYYAAMKAEEQVMISNQPVSFTLPSQKTTRVGVQLGLEF